MLMTPLDPLSEKTLLHRAMPNMTLSGHKRPRTCQDADAPYPKRPKTSPAGGYDNLSKFSTSPLPVWFAAANSTAYPVSSVPVWTPPGFATYPALPLTPPTKKEKPIQPYSKEGTKDSLTVHDSELPTTPRRSRVRRINERNLVAGVLTPSPSSSSSSPASTPSTSSSRSPSPTGTGFVSVSPMNAIPSSPGALPPCDVSLITSLSWISPYTPLPATITLPYLLSQTSNFLKAKAQAKSPSSSPAQSPSDSPPSSPLSAPASPLHELAETVIKHTESGPSVEEKATVATTPSKFVPPPAPPSLLLPLPPAAFCQGIIPPRVTSLNAGKISRPGSPVSTPASPSSPFSASSPSSSTSNPVSFADSDNSMALLSALAETASDLEEGLHTLESLSDSDSDEVGNVDR